MPWKLCPYPRTCSSLYRHTHLHPHLTKLLKNVNLRSSTPATKHLQEENLSLACLHSPAHSQPNTSATSKEGSPLRRPAPVKDELHHGVPKLPELAVAKTKAQHKHMILKEHCKIPPATPHFHSHGWGNHRFFHRAWV